MDLCHELGTSPWQVEHNESRLRSLGAHDTWRKQHREINGKTRGTDGNVDVMFPGVSGAWRQISAIPVEWPCRCSVQLLAPTTDESNETLVTLSAFLPSSGFLPWTGVPGVP